MKNRYVFALIMMLGAAFFAGGAYYFYGSWAERMRIGTESEDWPTTPATYQSAYVEYVDPGSSRRDHTPYRPMIGYSYDVDGMGYYSSMIASTHPGFESREKARAWIDVYPKAGLVAHYNPENPSEAVLEPGVPFGWRLLVLLPVICALTAFMFLYLAVKTLIYGVPEAPPEPPAATSMDPR